MTETSERMRAGNVLIRRAPALIEATIDRPGVFNAIDAAVVEGLECALDIAERDAVSVVVLRGSGGNFCSGADLKYVGTLLDDLDAGLFPYIERLHSICDRLAEGPFVSLALVEGFALAGGFEMLAACDLAVATTTAKIGDRHLEYALAPGLGVAVRAPRQLTAKRARFLAFTGDTISGEEAASWGLVSHAWPPEAFEERALGLIERVASRSPRALQLYKRMLLSAERDPFDVAMRHEEAAFREYQRLGQDVPLGLEAFNAKR